MKPFLRTALVTGTAFGVFMGLFWAVVGAVGPESWLGGPLRVALAVVSGVPFGLAMAGFAAIQRRRFARVRPELAGEDLLHDGPANHWLHGEGVGGWLFLTKERLLFRSHRFNVQRHELSVPLADITRVRAVRTAKLFPNGLRVNLGSGHVERFVVRENRRWCEEILKARGRVA